MFHSAVGSICPKTLNVNLYHDIRPNNFFPIIILIDLFAVAGVNGDNSRLSVIYCEFFVRKCGICG